MRSEHGILEMRTLSSAPTWVGTYFKDIPLLSCYPNTKKPQKQKQKTKRKKKKAKIINYNTLAALTHVCGINN